MQMGSVQRGNAHEGTHQDGFMQQRLEKRVTEWWPSPPGCHNDNAKQPLRNSSSEVGHLIWKYPERMVMLTIPLQHVSPSFKDLTNFVRIHFKPTLHSQPFYYLRLFPF